MWHARLPENTLVRRTGGRSEYISVYQSDIVRKVFMNIQSVLLPAHHCNQVALVATQNTLLSDAASGDETTCRCP